MGVTEEKVARFIVETKDEEIPREALKWAWVGSFDCVGTMLAGAASPPGKIMTKLIKASGGTPEATVVGTGLRTNVVMGALANGTLAHALDYDDQGGFGHPSCVLTPPLLTLGERLGASGKDILKAYVIGFRVGAAINAGCRYVQQERGFHSTAIYGIMAATAACARLLKLNVEQTVMALGVTGSMGSGILQNFGTYTKGLHAGLADHNAVMACLLAQDDWKGTDRVFESKVGFLHSYVGNDLYDLEAIGNALDKRPLANEVAIKKYPSCGGNHNVLDAILSLMKENKINFEDIERVDIYGVPSIHYILLYPEPAYGFQGKFSIHYNAATAIIDKRIDHDSFTDEKLNRPEFRQAMNKLDIHLVPPWDPNFKPVSAENPVTITLKNGRTFSRTINRRTFHGSPADPLTDEEFATKFKANAALSLPKNMVDRACDLWWNMEKMADVREGLQAIAGTP